MARMVSSIHRSSLKIILNDIGYTVLLLLPTLLSKASTNLASVLALISYGSPTGILVARVWAICTFTGGYAYHGSNLFNLRRPE